MARDKSLQAKHLSDAEVLAVLLDARGVHGAVEAEHVVDGLPGWPRKVVLRKLDSLHRRQIIWCVPDQAIHVYEVPTS